MTLLGITTDGSSLSPAPLAEVLSWVPHQLCQFHVVKDSVKAVLSAESSARKSLEATQPTLPRGRPGTKAATQAARKKKRLNWNTRTPMCSRIGTCVSQHDLSQSECKLALGVEAEELPNFDMTC